MSEVSSRSSPNFFSLIVKLTIALVLLLFVCNVATPTSALSSAEHQYLYECCVAQVIFRHKDVFIDPQTKQSIAKCTDKLCSDHRQEVLALRQTEDALNKLEAANPRAGRERVAASALLPKQVDPVKSKFFISLEQIFGWNEATVQKLRTALSKFPDQQALAKAMADTPNYIKTLVRQHKQRQPNAQKGQHNQLQPQHQPQGSQSNQLQPQPQPQGQPQPQPQPQGQPQGQPQPQGSQQNQFPVQHQEQGQPPKPPSKRIKTGGEKRTFDNYEQGQNGPLLGDNSGGSQLKTRKLGMRARKYPTAQTSLAETQTQTTSPITTITWPKAVIPYRFDPTFSTAFTNGDQFASEVRSNYYRAFDHFREHTCIRFQADPLAQSVFTSTGAGGKAVGTGPWNTRVEIDNLRYTAIHELGHAVGFEHTMTRQDRDDFVEYDEAACRNYYDHAFPVGSIPGQTKTEYINMHLAQYRKANVRTTADVGDYHFKSIMHYEFSACMKLHPSIETRVKRTEMDVLLGKLSLRTAQDVALLRHLLDAHEMNKVSDLSEQDVIGINQHYGCVKVRVTIFLSSTNKIWRTFLLYIHPSSTDKDLRRDAEWRFGLAENSLEHRLIQFNRAATGGINTLLDPRQTYNLNQLVIAADQVKEFVVVF